MKHLVGYTEKKLLDGYDGASYYCLYSKINGKTIAWTYRRDGVGICSREEADGIVFDMQLHQHWRGIKKDSANDDHPNLEKISEDIRWMTGATE